MAFWNRKPRNDAPLTATLEELMKNLIPKDVEDYKIPRGFIFFKSKKGGIFK